MSGFLVSTFPCRGIGVPSATGGGGAANLISGSMADPRYPPTSWLAPEPRANPFLSCPGNDVNPKFHQMATMTCCDPGDVKIVSYCDGDEDMHTCLTHVSRRAFQDRVDEILL